MTPKTIAIVGITGNQGGSVAQRFLQDPNYHIRGITRNPSSPAAQRLAAQGVELVSANLDDADTLIPAFHGASLIFSATDYWEPFFRADCRAKAQDLGISYRRYAYDVELRQGKNIADAAARTADSLDANGFIASTLSHARECSVGRFTELYHFDAKAEVFPGYVKETHPALARKMSCVQTGYFTSSYKLVPEAYFQKRTAADGSASFEMSFPTAPDAPVPHLDVNADLGGFVYAVTKMEPGKSYMASGTTCSWAEYMRMWGEVNSVPVRYRQATLDEITAAIQDREFGRELGDMFAYSSDPGYDGNDRDLLTPQDIQQAGIDCPMTSLEEWMRREDWSHVLQQA